MKENISSPELTLNIWSNDACRGYVIMAMQDCGFTHKDISRHGRLLLPVPERFSHERTGPLWLSVGADSG